LIISDDKNLLLRAEKRGIGFLNSLMMLICLYFYKEISETEYIDFRNILYKEARYAKWVVDYGNSAFLEMKSFNDSV
jgi:hypothetical protein